MIRRVLRLIATLTGLRWVAQVSGFCGGRRRVTQERQVVLFAAAAGAVVASTAALLSFLHVTAFKGVAR